MTNKIAIAMLTVLAATPAAAKPKVVLTPSAVQEYRLPVASVKVTLDLVLTQCAPTITAEPTFATAAVANMGQDSLFIDPLAMNSWNKARDITVELYPNRALKSVNGAVVDKTGAIITNILKAVAGVVMLADDTPAAQIGGCSPGISRQFDRRQALKAKIALEKANLLTVDPAKAKTLREYIDSLAQEVAALNTGPLHLRLEKDVPIDWETTSGKIGWKRQDLDPWMGPPAAGAAADTNDYFQIAVCAQKAPFDGAGCPQRTPPTQPALSCTNGCPNVLVFRDPVDAVLTFRSASKEFDGYNAAESTELGRINVPIPQWGTYSYLPLNAGFGQSKTFAFGLNEFGRISTFTWKANARGEAVSSSLADIVGAAGTLATNLKTEELRDWETRIKELETQKKLNELKACAEVIEAGGFTCPTPPKQ